MSCTFLVYQAIYGTRDPFCLFNLLESARITPPAIPPETQRTGASCASCQRGSIKPSLTPIAGVWTSQASGYRNVSANLPRPAMLLISSLNPTTSHRLLLRALRPQLQPGVRHGIVHHGHVSTVKTESGSAGRHLPRLGYPRLFAHGHSFVDCGFSRSICHRLHPYSGHRHQGCYPGKIPLP